ncbi:MAG: TIGR01777 family protein [Acidimicrobiia bacterium]
MRIAVLGATGFIGKAISLFLRSRGHAVLACVRSDEKGRRVLGFDCELFVDPSGVPDEDALSRCDAVVNVAGSPLVGRRWSERRIRDAENSRILLTERLVKTLAGASLRPRVLVSASAVGYYGAGSISNPPFEESDPPGSGFLSDLCVRWENAAQRADSLGMRVVIPRLGVVLGRFGGVLEVLEPLFRSGMGASIASGEQPFSWIHTTDVCRAVANFVEEDTFEGPVNLVAPTQTTYKEFVQSLALELGTKVRLSIPAEALRLALGEGSLSLLEGQRVIPSKLAEGGFDFAFPELKVALADLFKPIKMLTSKKVLPEEVFEGDCSLQFMSPIRGRPGVLIQSSFKVAAEKDEVFRFYSVPGNLAALIPPRIGFRILEAPLKAKNGSVVLYEVKAGPISKRYSGKIFCISEPKEFFDMTEGNSRIRWFHRHRFEDIDVPSDNKSERHFNRKRGTVIRDDLWFTLPATSRMPLLAFTGQLGTLVSRALFEYRAQVSKWRFGDADMRT